MKTFVARFVRPSGAVGVVHVMASSSVCAMLDVVKQVGGGSVLSVRPCRRAALLLPNPSKPSQGSEEAAIAELKR